jgi:hypothetical protein
MSEMTDDQAAEIYRAAFGTGPWLEKRRIELVKQVVTAADLLRMKAGLADQ